MANLIILKGLPLSGKTAWATKWAAAKEKRIRLSWTDILQSMGRGPGRLLRPLAVDAACRLVCEAMREGCDVVLDECNLYPAEFLPFVSRAKVMRASVEYRTIQCDIEKIKERNIQCGCPVREMKLERLSELYAKWLEQ